ncbi:MAG: CDP-diacylglycerol--serine O-phosphatidyltransferase [Gemmatimonadetes bacterium]|nr:CDP-diacylglycerol--serine O-phosphatidyltransferase [Gemmatimonadota bacterium]MBI2536293.1 CDP-diacylglycerol--serine O-phosphatidyltransferase [Gemmatimonadota bacterium]MBI2615466.1 CDP-diacylglycerol--serine O-phosphatidyltransferase [Gemmatimonadota bacterium]
MRPPPSGARVRRVVVVVPSLFTLANLFFGIWSMVLAWQGQFYRASWFIVIAGVLDLLDGVMARVSRTGTRFGAELDSLVDVVSFGVAPAMLTYLWFFSNQGQYAWVFGYAFIVCVALRLARYNVQSAGEHRATFSGLPSPAAGMTLATYYPFTRTPFYQSELAGLPWSQIMVFLTIALSLAMVSNIRYARVPRIGFRTWRGLLGLGVNLTILGFGIWERDIFFFPLGITYLTYGLVRAAVEGFLERGEDAAEGETERGVVLHDIDAAGRVRRREPGARDE